MSKIISSILVFVAMIIMESLSLPLRAEQVVIYDGQVKISGTFTHLMPDKTTPQDFKFPIDYTKGKIHIYVRVIENTTTAPVFMQTCWFLPGGKALHHCFDHRAGPELTMGEHQRMQKLSKMWKSHPGDYSLGIKKIMLVARDKNWKTMKLDGVVTLHLRLTLVSEGSDYQPPGHYGGLSPEALDQSFPEAASAFRALNPAKAYLAADRVILAEDQKYFTGAVRVKKAVEQHLHQKLRESLRLKFDHPHGTLKKLKLLKAQFRRTELEDVVDHELKSLKDDDQFKTELRAAEYEAKLRAEIKKTRQALRGKTFRDEGLLKYVLKRGQALTASYKAMARRYPEAKATARIHQELVKLGLVQ